MITAERSNNPRIAVGNKAFEGENLRRKLDEERHHKIEEAAYFKAEHRGFTPDHELDDWLEAQWEIEEASRPFPSY